MSSRIGPGTTVVAVVRRGSEVVVVTTITTRTVTVLTTLTTTTAIVGALGRHGRRGSGDVSALLRRGRAGYHERVDIILAASRKLGAGTNEGHLVIRGRVRSGVAAGGLVGRAVVARRRRLGRVERGAAGRLIAGIVGVSHGVELDLVMCPWQTRGENQR